MKTKAKNRATKKKTSEKEMIIVDEKNGLIFENEKDLFAYFSPRIAELEEKYQSIRDPDDFSDDEQVDTEVLLESTLDDPDYIYLVESSDSELPTYVLLKEIEFNEEKAFYVAEAYLSSEDDYPTFVYLHFPTKSAKVLAEYTHGELIYDRRTKQIAPAAIEGDGITEGDPYALNLHEAMMKVRSDKDIPLDRFAEYANLREDTIENADEIWRKNDLEGNLLVVFIKDQSEQKGSEEALFYVAITLEEPDTNVHSLLFSFPTNDESLVDRFRQGENLQAEEVSQESSH